MQAINYPARAEVAFQAIPDCKAGEGEVVVQVMASGICHTDFEVLNANYGTSAFPVVPGHEYTGCVVDVGTGVSGLRCGDRVVIDPNLECGHCRACKRGWAHLCEHLGAYGVTQNGGFAEYSAVNASAALPIGDLDYGIAALAEPMGCVLNGVDAVFEKGMQSALIFGAGPMGMLMAIALRNQGMSDIKLVDIDDTKLALAESFGFPGLASGSSALEELHHGVDLAVDATGIPSVASGLISYVSNGGKCLFFGVCPSQAQITVSPFEVFRRQLTLAGTHSLNHNIPAAIETIKASGPDLARIISHQLPLAEVASVLAGNSLAGSLKVQAVRH